MGIDRDRVHAEHGGLTQTKAVWVFYVPGIDHWSLST